MQKNFFFQIDPAIKSIYKKIIFGKGSKTDFEEISKSFVLEGYPIVQTDEKYLIDDSVAYLSKKACYVARRSGFVYMNDRELSVLPFLGVNEQKLYSFIIIPNQQFSKFELKSEIILSTFHSYGFNHKINNELIEQYLQLFQKSGGYKIIYQGIDMIPDRESDILLDDNFNLVYENSLNLNDRRILSSKEIEFFKVVSKGEKIGEFKLLIPGEEGVDVFGHPIPKKRIKSLYKIGEGLEKKTNGDIVASKGGVMRVVDGGQLVVRPARIVSNELKNSVKLETDEDVIISGRIFSNLSLSVKGDLTIIGSVESIKIQCEKNLYITNGINNKSSIKVNGSCIVQFIANSEVIANKNILVGQYTLNSNIKSYNDVVVMSDQFGEIVGGIVDSEGGNIETYSAGSVYGTPTVLKVGMKNIDLEIIKSCKADIKKLNKEKLFLENKIMKLNPLVSNQYERIKKNSELLSKFEMDQFKRNLQELKDYRIEFKKIQKELDKNEEIISEGDIHKQSNNQIKIHSGIFGGVTLQIMNIKYNFKYNYFKPVFFKKHPVLPKIERLSLDDHKR